MYRPSSKVLRHLGLTLCVTCLCLSGSAWAVVVLQYHHVSDTTPSSTSISPALFAEHMERIESLNLQVLSLPDVVRKLRTQQALPDRAVVITFDDAYDSIYEHAWPILKQRNWPFTVFVATDSVDQSARLMMSWQQLKTLAKAGITLANHTRSHTHLVRRLSGEDEAQWLARVEHEIHHAQQRLTEQVGAVPKVLAYPYGEYTAEIENLVSKMGYVAFGQHSGAVGLGHSLAALPRFPMNNQFGALNQLNSKLLSLPFAAKRAEPAQLILRDKADLAGGLVLHLEKPNVQIDQLACYLQGRGRIPVTVTEKIDTIQLSVRDLPDFAPGRARLNCTVPSAERDKSGRFYWYSHYWMRLLTSGEWYEER